MSSSQPLRRVNKKVLFEELLDPKTMGIRKRGDYGTGVAANVGEVAVSNTTDQLAASTAPSAGRYGVTSVAFGSLFR